MLNLDCTGYMKASCVSQVVIGILQLGFITMFLSKPLLSGYTTGAAMHVFTSQVKHITGLEKRLEIAHGPFWIPKVTSARRNI